jgi:hypothetical protein
MELALVSGGKGGCNLLQLATPISFSGGPGIATKDGLVSHIVIKESINEPLPAAVSGEYTLYVLSRSGTNHTIPVKILHEQLKNRQPQQSIPLFWEPEGQPGKKKVQYVGHWAVQAVTIKSFRYKDADRCGKITLKLDDYSDEFAKIIKEARGTVDTDPKEEMGGAGEVVPFAVKSEKLSVDNDFQEHSKVEWKGTQARNGQRHGDATASSAEETVPIAVGSGKPVEVKMEDKREPKGKRRYEPTDDEEGNTKRTAVAETVSSSNVPTDNVDVVGLTYHDQQKYLEEYSAAEVAQLVAGKGAKFQALAEQLQEADVKGAFIVDELKKGEDHFQNKFLHELLGLDDKCLRWSVHKSFQQIPSRK